MLCRKFDNATLRYTELLTRSLSMIYFNFDALDWNKNRLELLLQKNASDKFINTFDISAQQLVNRDYFEKQRIACQQGSL